MSYIEYNTGWTKLESVTTFWQHCCSPGFLYRALSDSEMYIKNIEAIYAIDLDTQLLIADFTSYSFDLRKSDAQESTPEKWEIEKSSPCLRKIRVRLDIALLERVFPKLGERAKLGLDIGLSPQEIVRYAINIQQFSKDSIANRELPKTLQNKLV